MTGIRLTHNIRSGRLERKVQDTRAFAGRAVERRDQGVRVVEI
jgi:hypothetical protein